MAEYKMCPNTDHAIYILEFIQRNYQKHSEDAGVQKYIEALQMGIEALELTRRQREEIEELQNKCGDFPVLKAKNNNIDSLNKQIKGWQKGYCELKQEFKTAKAEAIKDVLLTLETAVEESNKYIREYEDSKEQRAYNQALRKAYNLVKEMEGANNGTIQD